MENTYPIGHPWYYKLGGKIQSPTQIMLEVKAEQYRSYLKDRIEAIDKKPEPNRSNKMKELKLHCRNELKRDLDRYRDLIVELRAHRKQHGEVDESSSCAELYVSLSLKYSHIFNHMGALNYINELMMKAPKQYDLFA
ncbi:MAG: hypothetical protein CML06_17785 [Pseudomonadales bacterium]|nr:hypothetical protein [Pseudomonadales bacterium]